MNVCVGTFDREGFHDKRRELIASVQGADGADGAHTPTVVP